MGFARSITGVSLALSLVAAAPHAAAAGPVEAAQAPPFADVVVDDSMDDVELTRGWGGIGVRRGIARQSIDESKLGARRLTVELRGTFGDYHVVVGLRESGEWIGDAAVRACACTDEEMIEAVASMVAELAKDLEATAEVRPPAPVATKPPVDDRSARPRPAPLSPLGGAGIGLTAGGAALLATGIGLMVRGRVADEPTVPENDVGTNAKSPGIGLTAAGATILLSGLVMLGVERSRARKRVRGGAAWGPGGVGVHLEGRF